MAKRKKSKFWLWLILVAVLAVVCAFLTAYFHRKSKDEVLDEPTEFTVLETVIEWEDEAMTIDLLSGTVKTTDQVDKVFVNVNGHGAQYLEFTTEKIETDESVYFLHTLSPQHGLLSTVFGSDTTITIDVYVEYGGRSHKVDVQNVKVSSCWVGNY